MNGKTDAQPAGAYFEGVHVERLQRAMAQAGQSCEVSHEALAAPGLLADHINRLTAAVVRNPELAAQPVAQGEREAILRAAVAAMPHANPLVADDLIEGHTMHTEADDIIAIWQASRSSAQGAAQVPQWTSVHDALPQCSEDEDVPVWTWDGIAVNEDAYGPIFEQPAGPAVGGWVNVGHGFSNDTMGRVTHWLPRTKPAAPHGEGER